ncbi:MAG: hypothetical protein JXR03_07945 [Cyclobacteriaceae bacterium]
MTLSASNKKLYKSGLVLLALIPFFFACDDPNALGVDLDNENAKTVTETITFDLPVSTIYIDSLRTDNDNVLIVGSTQDDPTFGDIKAIGYSEFIPGTGGYLPTDTVVFERAFLILESTSDYISGAAASQNITVYETTDTLFSAATYLSKINVEYDNTMPLGSISEALGEQDSIFSIDLSDAFGRDLYVKLDSAQDNGAYTDSLNSGVKPALVLEPSDNNQSIFNFDLTSDTVGIYIEMKDPDNDSLLYFKFNLAGDYYSQILRDRSGSTYASLVNNYDSVSGGENTHLNMIAGIHPRLDLNPYLDFLSENENIIVNRAEISIPTDNSDGSPEVNNIRYFIPSSNGRINGPAFLVNQSQIKDFGVLSNSGYRVFNGFPSMLISSFDNDDNSYFGNVTNFCQALLDFSLWDQTTATSKLVVDAKQLILYGATPTLVGQSTIPSSGITLKVYYTRLK